MRSLRPIAVGLFALAVVPAAGAHQNRCDPARVRLRLLAEGTATQTVVFLRASSLHASGCADSGTVVFRIGGAAGRVRHNPLAVPVTTTTSDWWGPDTADVAHVWWANWCGRRAGLAVEATYRGRSVSSRRVVPPACIDSARPSTLRRPSG